VLGRGLAIDDFVSRFSFNFNIFGNLWEQVAKFRAARRLWAKIIKERYGAKDPKSLWLRMLAGGGGKGLTKEQPENNIVRSAYYALSSALSGTQTMALCSYDEAFTIPTPKSALISLRTMQLLMEEVGLRDTVDPLAGSYYVETLTNQMEEKIAQYMQEVEKIGGMAHAVESGYVQREVSQQAFLYEKALQEGEVRKVGVNIYRDEEAVPEVELHDYNVEAAALQIKALQEVKRQRDNRQVAATLKAIEQAAREKKNVMSYLVDAVRAYATVGEMTEVFKTVYGEFNEPDIF
jgi:methylmalonyl-CoA mutase N-terminal domain/subunit